MKIQKLQTSYQIQKKRQTDDLHRSKWRIHKATFFVTSEASLLMFLESNDSFRIRSVVSLTVQLRSNSICLNFQNNQIHIRQTKRRTTANTLETSREVSMIEHRNNILKTRRS